MNFKETVRDEVIEHEDSMTAVTTAAIVKCLDLPVDGLSQRMHDSTEPIRMQDIIDTPEVDEDDHELGAQISIFLISNAIHKVHSIAVDSIFEDASQYPRMPTIDALPVRKTQYQQLGAILKDEGTIAGTMQVHDKIFLEQLGFSKNDTVFSRRLFPVYGNALTTKLVRRVKLEQFNSSHIFQRRE